MNGTEPGAAAAPRARRRRGWTRYAVVGAGLLVVGLAFVYALPQIADYRDVWGSVSALSWRWLAALAAAAAANIATFAPPWMAGLPGLGFRHALVLSQASTALSIVTPAGAAVGMAGSYGMLRSWGFSRSAVARAVTLTGVWNQFANLVFPVCALLFLTIEGQTHPALAVAAFVGVALLGAAVAALALVLASRRLAREIGDTAASGADWLLARVGRGPVRFGGHGLGNFRDDALDLLRRRWHGLTLATLGGHLTVFVVLLVALRALGVPAAEVSLAEAFAAWSLARILGAIPLTPGGLGVVELSLSATLIGFGGSNAAVVAAVLVYRFLTVVPVLALGGFAALTWRHHRPAPDEEGLRAGARNVPPMEEQSHKREMAAALRGDFERLRARRSQTTDEAPPPDLPAAPAADDRVSGEEPRRSFVARLLGR